jgi:hypothetical protein
MRHSSRGMEGLILVFRMYFAGQGRNLRRQNKAGYPNRPPWRESARPKRKLNHRGARRLPYQAGILRAGISI